MKHNSQFKFRIPKADLAAAHEAASRNGQQLTNLIRRYLEAYASAQPTKQAA